MEETKTNLSCKYLGCVYVDKSSGMETLRPAIEKISKTVPEDKWISVIVSISPSSFTICVDNVRLFLSPSLFFKFDVFVLFSYRKQRKNYSIFVFVIYPFLVLDKIQGNSLHIVKFCFSIQEIALVSVA